MLADLRSDIFYALRTVRRSPGFAAAVVVPIALGIGINTGVFSILNSIVLRPLGTPGSAELLSVYQEFQGGPRRRVHGARVMFSVPEYRRYRDSARTLAVMAYSKPWTAALRVGESVQEIDGALVSCNYFEVLQIRTALGTGLTTGNCEPAGRAPGIVISHALWTQRLDADPEIARRTITMNGVEVAIAGVAPPGFDGVDMTKAAFFAPTALQPVLHPERDFSEDPHTSWLTIVARRNPGVSLARARTDLEAAAQAIDREIPGRTTSLIVAPATSLSLPIARQGFLASAGVVMAAFALVLLIACANVANVLLARAADRSREMAIRASLGATRGRLARQLLTESAIFAVAGGASGSLLGLWSCQALLVWLSANLPASVEQPRLDANPDLTVLWFAAGLTVTTALICGLLPAVQGSRRDVHSVMKREAGFAGGRPARWLRGALIAAQVAVCMVLLVAAGLLLRALHAAHTIDPGFIYENVVTATYDLRSQSYDDASVAAFRRRAAERIAALPGVNGVAEVGRIPLSPGRTQGSLRLQGVQQSHLVDFNLVSPAYFEVLGIPIVRGRTFTDAELRGASRPVIVTEATARRYWPGRDPVGLSVLVDETLREIVGVAADAQVSHMARVESSYVYVPAGAQQERALRLLVRSDAGFGTLATAIAAATRELDPGMAVRVNRLSDNLELWRAGSRAVAGLSGSVSLLALVLACSGVYGVVAYVVTRRLREMGIRITLGATPHDVRVLILRQTMRPVGAGVLIGVAGAAGASQVLGSLLFGISPFDPAAYAGAAVLLGIVATAASLVPARAAVKVDPMATLRSE